MESGRVKSGVEWSVEDGEWRVEDVEWSMEASRMKTGGNVRVERL